MYFYYITFLNTVHQLASLRSGQLDLKYDKKNLTVTQMTALRNAIADVES